VLANHKGGVTKTTSTANLGALFAEAGYRVLMVDCDPQANLSEVFGWTEDVPGERLEDLLARPDAAGRYMPPLALQPDVGVGLEWRERLSILPCTDALADVAADLPNTVGDGYELALDDLLAPLRAMFDFIVLDTPPGLGNLSGMAVIAADGLLIPALAADLDIRGAGKLYDLVEMNIPDLKVLGVLIAASERRWRVTQDAADRMKADDMRVLPVRVPRTVRVASAPRYRAPTAVLEPDSIVTHAYRQVVQHLLEELGR
jgi:chromosome partitioning protein